MEMLGDLATLYGVSVVPDMRRRGIQLAMMAWRLREAARRGAVIVTIGSLPGASTESNAMRMGFRVAYTKAVMVRPGAGLTPVEVG
jgi:predicted acetyltransferase